MLKPAEYYRNGAIIVEAQEGNDGVRKVVFPLSSKGPPSINAAKRESRKLQAGQLGSGILRVI